MLDARYTPAQEGGSNPLTPDNLNAMDSEQEHRNADSIREAQKDADDRAEEARNRRKATLTDDEKRVKCAELCGTLDRWVLVKGGYYYRPHAAGYTNEISVAGVWTEAEADKHMLSCGEVVKRRLPPPDYLTSLDAAITLCDALAKEGWNWKLESMRDGKVRCHFFKNSLLNESIADTPAKAIVENFLKTKGIAE